MRITGATVAIDTHHSERLNLCVEHGRVSFAATANRSGIELDLSGYLLLPGLINAHDHLEFNLFPKLGGGSYPNAKAWAADIHRPSDSPVKEHLALSMRARLMWGGLKNLMSGVTTVAHHNPVDGPHFGPDFPVNIVRQFGWAHSLDFSPDLSERFRATPADWPFLVHAAEGVDRHAQAEIARLDSLGVLCERTVLIHAIGLDQPDLELVKTRGSGIVWCPSSNLGVYGRTLTSRVLGSGLNIALGTDSAMTAQTDLLGEIGIARKESGVSATDLYEMVTTRAARLLRLHDGQGEIRDGGVADFIAVRDQRQTPAEALFRMTPELVIVRGRVRLIARRLFTPCLLRRIENGPGEPMHGVTLEGRGHWLTDVDVPALHEETVQVLGPQYRLAGRRVHS